MGTILKMFQDPQKIEKARGRWWRSQSDNCDGCGKGSKTFPVSILHPALQCAISPVLHCGCSANISESFLLGPSTQWSPFAWALSRAGGEPQGHTQAKQRLSILNGGKKWPISLVISLFPFLEVSPQECGEVEFLSKDRIWGRGCQGE